MPRTYQLHWQSVCGSKGIFGVVSRLRMLQTIISTTTHPIKWYQIEYSKQTNVDFFNKDDIKHDENAFSDVIDDDNSPGYLCFLYIYIYDQMHEMRCYYCWHLHSSIRFSIYSNIIPDERYFLHTYSGVCYLNLPFAINVIQHVDTNHMQYVPQNIHTVFLCFVITVMS